ncbi:MAG: DUF616 domain-containing protein [Cyclobacteriaceae bacterium]|nr:DUF616 domain-containing protein [Cyclobacteriaceae bacterium]
MKSTNKIAVYTAIFGPYDGLLPQPKLANVDYICFTDQPFRSKTWKIVPITPVFEDLTRNARMIKVLPHRYLPDYEVSVFMDGNFLILKDISPLVAHALSERPMAIFDHNKVVDKRNCIYDEYDAILALQQRRGKLKDDPDTMRHQVERYRMEGYPEQNGLISSGVLLRKHHDPHVRKTMETWWNEICEGSKRDQLSFNYAAWKNQFDPVLLPYDLRNNEFFYLLGKHRKNNLAKLIKFRLKRFFGLG